MAKTIHVELSEQSIEKAIREIEAYQAGIKRKTDLLAKRLANLGATKVSAGYALAQYDGRKDISVSVEKRQKGYAIVANGESVLFVEFGAGAKLGYGHPEADDFKLGPGTYPFKHSRPDPAKGGALVDNWEHSQGWWIPKDQGGGHTYGNAPSMTMYRAEQELQQEILAIAQEVFGND